MSDEKTWVFKIQGDDRQPQYSFQAKTEAEALAKIGALWTAPTVLPEPGLWGSFDLSGIMSLDGDFSAIAQDKGITPEELKKELLNEGEDPED